MCSSGGGTGRSLMSPCSVEDTGRAGQGELNGQAAGAHAAAARCSCTGGLGGLCMGAGGWFIGKPRPTRLGSSDGADFHSDMVTAHGKTAHGASVELSWYRVLSTASACDALQVPRAPAQRRAEASQPRECPHLCSAAVSGAQRP